MGKSGNLSDQELLDSSFWHNYGIEFVMKPLMEKMTDSENDSFHMGFHDDWSPKSKLGKTPWVIARQVFSLAAAYMLYGEEKYLEMARPQVNWLFKNAWDHTCGGWFETLSPQGEPLEMHKTEFNHLYVETGLAFYYLVTKDKEVLKKIEESSAFHSEYFWEKESGGYVKELHREGSIKTPNKDFCGQFVPLSGPWIYMYSATRDQSYLDKINRIINVAVKHMKDTENGWILERFDKDWNYDPKQTGNKEVNLGHSMETAWCFQRLFHLTGDADLMQEGKELAELCFEHGYDEETHIWPTNMSRIPGEKNKSTNWWVQEYGNFISLYMYKTTGEKKYLDVFLDTARFYMTHFLDHQNGGEHLGIDMDDSNTVLTRSRPESGYHSTEHALLISSYLDLFIHKKPVILYFNLTAEEEGEKHYVCPIESPDVHLTSVKINGEEWKSFDKVERSVTLPKGERMRIEIVIESE